MANLSRGRPAGGSDARERLIEAASLLFLRDGYAATSVRGIAREAGVNHALVNYHFGDKQTLFAEVMALALTPTNVLDEVFAQHAATGEESPSRLAERLISTMLTAWEKPELRDPFLDMLRRSLDDDATRTVVSEFFTREVVARVAAHIRGPQASQRAMAVGSVVAGMIFTRYLLRVEPIASMQPRDIVRVLAPMVAVHLR